MTYVLDKEESERINILKFISIVLVVYIHAYGSPGGFADGTAPNILSWWFLMVENLISQVIARCAVPIFFLISSILLFKKQRNYRTTIMGKIKTLLIPYFIWNSLWILESVIIEKRSFLMGAETLAQYSFSEWLSLYGIGISLPYPKDYPLWFIRDLMIVVLGFPVIGKVANSFPKLVLFCAIGLLLIPIDFSLKQALLWFCVGACMIRLQVHITAFDNIALWKLTLIYILSAFITLLAKITVVNNLFIILGIVYWIRVTKYIFDNEKLRLCFLKLSEWTFIVYAAHELTLSTLKHICLKRLPGEPIWYFAEYLILPIIVISGCVIAGTVLKMIVPKLYGVLSGER